MTQDVLDMPPQVQEDDEVPDSVPVPGALIDTGSRSSVFAGYLLGAALMIAAAAVAWRYCVAAERRSLESVAPPLAFVE